MAEDVISGVFVFNVSADSVLQKKFDTACHIYCGYDPDGMSVRVYVDVYDKTKQPIFEFPITPESEVVRFGISGKLINLGNGDSILLKFDQEQSYRKFHKMVDEIKGRCNTSVFTQRTEETSASQYFQFYGYLCQQQNMMQDYVRTSTYQKAVHSNLSDFEGKVILDVGAGSGILSFFAAQAGARKVYAVEASNMVQFAQQLVDGNNMADIIQVVAGKIEEIDLPEMVDLIISEPMGFMLYNERMLETYIHARKWLKPGGKMFPSRADLHVAPFKDESLYMEQFNKANFWCQNEFHGVDLSSLRNAAMNEYFRQPIVDTFDIRCCISKSVRHSVDFLATDETDLHRIDVPLNFHILETGICHGLAFWFDVQFEGSTQPIWLSTSPTEPLTHWYQVRCLLQGPIFVKQGQMLTGNLLLAANKRQSYDVTINLEVEGTTTSVSSTMDMKNPYFRYTGTPLIPPPGNNTTSPSENYWGQLETQCAPVIVNELTLNGFGEIVSITDNLNAGVMTLGSDDNQPNIHPGCIPSTGRTSRTSNTHNDTSNTIATVIGNGDNNGGNIANYNMNGINFLGNLGDLSAMQAAVAAGLHGHNVLMPTTSTQNGEHQQLIGGEISPSNLMQGTTIVHDPNGSSVGILTSVDSTEQNDGSIVQQTSIQQVSEVLPLFISNEMDFA